VAIKEGPVAGLVVSPRDSVVRQLKPHVVQRLLGKPLSLVSAHLIRVLEMKPLLISCETQRSAKTSMSVALLLTHWAITLVQLS
jgi:hypothetical protein